MHRDSAIRPKQGQGISNIIFSSNITTGNTLSTACQLIAFCEISEMQAPISPVIDLNKERLWHFAARMFTIDMQTLQISTKKCPSSDELSFVFKLVYHVYAFAFIEIHSMFSCRYCIQPSLLSGNGTREKKGIKNAWQLLSQSFL